MNSRKNPSGYLEENHGYWISSSVSLKQIIWQISKLPSDSESEFEDIIKKGRLVTCTNVQPMQWTLQLHQHGLTLFTGAA